MSAAAAITASSVPTASVAAPTSTTSPAPASPRTNASAKARWTSDRRPAWCVRVRVVTASPSCPSRRETIVTERTTSTNVPRPSGSRKRLWTITRTSAIGVERPRKRSVSIVFRPTSLLAGDLADEVRRDRRRAVDRRCGPRRAARRPRAHRRILPSRASAVASEYHFKKVLKKLLTKGLETFPPLLYVLDSRQPGRAR